MDLTFVMPAPNVREPGFDGFHPCFLTFCIMILLKYLENSDDERYRRLNYASYVKICFKLEDSLSFAQLPPSFSSKLRMLDDFDRLIARLLPIGPSILASEIAPFCKIYC